MISPFPATIKASSQSVKSIGIGAYRGYNTPDFNGNGGNMHRLSRHSPAITAISCLMAMLWMPVAQGQTAPTVPGPINWMGRLLAIPAATLHASAKQRRTANASAAAGHFSAHWMPPGLSLWAVATAHVLHAWHHGCQNTTHITSPSRPGKSLRVNMLAAILLPHGRFMRVFAARPPPSML